MRLLLDTHVLLWALEDSDKLGVDTRMKLKQAVVSYVSAASVWEARIKAGLGKLELPNGFLQAVATSGFAELAVDWEAAEAVDEVDLPHKDPFDRMLVVQARQEQLMLVTADEVLLKAYPEMCLDGRL